MKNNYSLKDLIDSKEGNGKSTSPLKALAKMLPLLKKERKWILVALIAVFCNALFNLIGPLGVGYTINKYVITSDYKGILYSSLILFSIFILAYISNYIQMRVMGGVTQRILWQLRNDLFLKIQELPLSFFNQNKTGDLISRINRDTEKVNEFFSQGLIRFASNIFLIIGAGVFILFINFILAAAALLPGVFLIIFTQIVSAWVGRVNKDSSSASGQLSAEIQESITNFKVILAFNRRDYFKKRFMDVNSENFKKAFRASIANELFTPVFEWMGNIALIVVLGYGLVLISQGNFAVGFLVSFVIYVTRFYDPLREMARLWSTFQTALAAWNRINVILHLKSDLQVLEGDENSPDDGKGLIEFRNVSFGYSNSEIVDNKKIVTEKKVLENINFIFEKGKTYALVGPTGGGKTTAASLIARLYDPSSGVIYLSGKDIRKYDFETRTKKIGFILQEPFLFTGTVKDNLLYGLKHLQDLNEVELDNVLKKFGFDKLISRFEKGLNTPVDSSGITSLGERQLIAFMRAVLHEPEILILDEATANVDTVTEKLLEEILNKLPKETTRVIIAHRLNTIANADDIFFVNGGEIREAGSMEHAVDMLLHGKRSS